MKCILMSIMVVAAFLAHRCETNPDPDPDTVDCEAVCENMEELQCEGWEGDPDAGVSCVEMCVDIASGPVEFDLECIAAAETCEAADECGGR